MQDKVRQHPTYAKFRDSQKVDCFFVFFVLSQMKRSGIFVGASHLEIHIRPRIINLRAMRKNAINTTLVNPLIKFILHQCI